MDNGKKLTAFVKKLPVDSTEYSQILGESETQTMRSGLVTLKSDESVGEHSTNTFEEMLVVLNGKGEVEINKGETRLNIEKGQIAYIPPNTIHNVFNKSDSILQYIYIVARAV